VIARALVCLALALALPAAAQMYKWVDEKGVTHYTETPPPDRKSTKVEIRPSPPAARASDASESWKERDLEFRTRRVEKEEEKERAERNAAARKDRCRRSREALDDLQNRAAIYRLDDRGERVYLEDIERTREIEVWRARAKENCDG
jgi:hypothetical protein